MKKYLVLILVHSKTISLTNNYNVNKKAWNIINNINEVQSPTEIINIYKKETHIKKKL